MTRVENGGDHADFKLTPLNDFCDLQEDVLLDRHALIVADASGERIEEQLQSVFAVGIHLEHEEVVLDSLSATGSLNMD